MVASLGQRETEAPEVPEGAIEGLAAAALIAGEQTEPRAALTPICRAAAAATSADAAIVRTLDPTGRWLVAQRRVVEVGGALRGARRIALPGRGAAARGDRRTRRRCRRSRPVPPCGWAPPACCSSRSRPAAGRSAASSCCAARRLSSRPSSSLARLAAAQLTLALLALGAAQSVDGARLGAVEALRLAGEALAAGSDERAVAEQVARLAAEASGATACLVWITSEDGGEPAARRRARPRRPAGGVGRRRARGEGARRAPAGRRRARRRAPGGAAVSSILPLGQPPLGALQLLFEEGRGAARRPPAPRHLRRPRRPRAAGQPARAAARGRAGAEPGPARGRGAGVRRALAGADAGHGDRPRRRAARRRPARHLPAHRRAGSRRPRPAGSTGPTSGSPRRCSSSCCARGDGACCRPRTRAGTRGSAPSGTRWRSRTSRRRSSSRWPCRTR